MAITELDRKRISKWCEDQTPPEYRDQLRVEARFQGNSADILELRPPWRDDFGPEWSERRFAKLTWNPPENNWTLDATDRNGRLLHYSDELPVGTTLPEMLQEIDDDPTSIFRG